MAKECHRSPLTNFFQLLSSLVLVLVSSPETMQTDHFCNVVLQVTDQTHSQEERVKFVDLQHGFLYSLNF